MSESARVERLQEVSEGLAEAAARAAPWVVRLEGASGGPAPGIVWSSDGVLVAASHAVDDEETDVGLEGGEVLRARLAGRDPTTDVAVLRAGRGGLAAAEWASAPPRVGSLLLALSRPGRGLRAALGAVARTGGEWRTAAGGRVDRWLEADLPLRRGFSGSLLVDAAGRGLGLAAAGLVRESALGLPPETLRRVVDALLAHGVVRRGYLGVVTFPVRLPPAAERAAGQKAALLVTGVEPGSPADRAGLLLGDAILSVEGRPVAHAADLLPFLEADRIGGALRARLWRASAPVELSVTVGARGEGGGSP